MPVGYLSIFYLLRILMATLYITLLVVPILLSIGALGTNPGVSYPPSSLVNGRVCLGTAKRTWPKVPSPRSSLN